MGGKDGNLTLHKIELTVKDIVVISKGLAIDNNIKEIMYLLCQQIFTVQEIIMI